MEANVKRREWVKTAAIIFLAVLLILTFFSNTIMNHSLPEVATQSVQSGSINAKIRGSGTVAANETYDVTINQTRKIASVLVKVGQTVEAGDTLFILDSMESTDLTAAKSELESMELEYETALLNASIDSAKEDRTIQKAREAYNEALALCQRFSGMSAAQLKQEKVSAEQKKKDMERELSELKKAKESVEKEKTEASSGITELEADYAEISALKDAVDTLKRDQYLYGEYADLLLSFAQHLVKNGNLYYYQNATQVAAALAKDESRYNAEVDAQWLSDFEDIEDLKGKYSEVSTAYTIIAKDNAAVEALNPLNSKFNIISNYDSDGVQITDENGEPRYVISNKIVENKYASTVTELEEKKESIDGYDRIIEQYETSIDNLTVSIEDQADYISDLADAQTYADAADTAKENLEDLLFEQELADPSSLSMQSKRDAIEKQKEKIAQLEADAEGGEVTADVSGVISAINITAGNTIGPQQALATIQVVDRGYTIKISVTMEQAKKVTVGDKADLVNYWGGDIEATLENIANDPSNPGKGRLLIFRLTGDVEPDTNLTLSIGQKSANYDALVPNSAVRSDSNGSFVLAVTVKSSPLGNRYTATRVDVKVLASDDTMSAVSGVSQGDFVITTSTKPIEAGTLVRLAENG